MNLSSLTGRPLWRNPQQGKLLGVCAGLAEYFNVPVNIVRFIAILSLFAGVFFVTILLYLTLGFFLEPRPQPEAGDASFQSAQELLANSEMALQQSERKLQAMEEYLTSETYATRSRFRQL